MIVHEIKHFRIEGMKIYLVRYNNVALLNDKLQVSPPFRHFYETTFAQSTPAAIHLVCTTL